MGTTSRTVRRDAYPEHFDYRDDGCHLHPACLTCPRLLCIFDEPQGARARQLREETRTIRQLLADGVTVGEVAARLRITRRSVYRRLQALREWEGAGNVQEDASPHLIGLAAIAARSPAAGLNIAPAAGS
jgi:hypothetical protein